MSSKPKYHGVDNDSSFKDVYKSPFLGAIDFDDSKDTIVILERAFSAVGTFEGGREQKVVFGVLKGYDQEIVINATNSKQIAKFANSIYPKDWVNIPLQIYVDNHVKGKGGEIVSGWRIRTRQPVLKKPELTPDHPKWAGAVDSFVSGNTTIDAIKKHYELSAENEALLNALKAEVQNA